MPTTRSPRSSSALATWKPMKPAAPVRRIDIRLLALSGEFKPEAVGRGNFPYILVVLSTRLFVGRGRVLGVGRGAPAGTARAAAERSATTSAPTGGAGVLSI